MPPRIHRRRVSATPVGPDVEAVLDGLKEDEPGKVSESTAPKKATPRAGSLERRLREMFQNMGAGIMFMDPVCGGMVAKQAPALAEAFDALAKENATIRRWLEGAIQGGAYAGVLQACFPIVITVAAHHGNINPEIAAALGIDVPIRKQPTRGEQAVEGESTTSAA